jgi:hypothetical protein
VPTPERIPTQHDEAPRPRDWQSRLDVPDRIAIAVITLQLGLLAWAAYPGSFLGDDLVRSTEAARSALDSRYLLSDVFGHLAPGYRLVFWLQAHAVPLDHGAATSLLLAVQAGTLLLAWRTFRLVLGDGYRALVPMVVYAVSPLALPSFLWWSSAVNLVPCHLAILAATRWHVLSLRTGSRRQAVYATAAVAAGLLFWEKTGLVLVELPLLTLLLLPGDLRTRLRALARRWRRWLLYWSPVVVLAVPYLSGRYAAPSAEVSLGTVVSFVGATVWHGVLPAVIGGPVGWSPLGTYFSVAAPPAWVSWAGLVAVAAVAVVAWRRWGRRSAALAAYVAGAGVAGAVVTAYGRAGAFGLTVARDYRYLSDVLPVLAIAIGLALAGRPSTRPAPTGPATRVTPAAATTRYGRTVAAIACAAVLVLATTSTIRYAEIWARNPVGTYLANVRADLARPEGTSLPTLYDSVVPTLVLDPVYAPYNHPSAVLAPLRRPPSYDDPYTDPQLVDEEGHVRPARFQVASSSAPGPDGECGWWAPDGSVTVPLRSPVVRGYWTVVVYFTTTAPTPVAVTVEDGAGELPTFVNPDRTTLPQGLGRLYAHTSDTPVTAVRLSGLTADACAFRVDVGRPVPVGTP